MTLNQVIARLQAIALSHRQIETFYYGNLWEVLNATEGKVTYPLCIVEHNTSTISAAQRLTSHRFRIYLFDLVNVANDTESNETEVLSDMMSVAEDLVALIKSPIYESGDNDVWLAPGEAAVALFTEKLNDMTAGVAIDIDIASPYPLDRCQVPTA